MEIFNYKQGKENSTTIRVSSEEAIRLIKSLSHQIMLANPNVGREEFTDKNGRYFTIFVIPPEKNEEVEEYAKAKEWGLSDKQIMENKALRKDWEILKKRRRDND